MLKIILVTGIILLLIRYGLFFLYKPQLHDGQQVSFTTTLLDEPKTSARFNRLTTEYSNMFGAERILITYAPQTQLHYGDTVRISGRIEETVLGKNTIMTMYMPSIRHSELRRFGEASTESSDSGSQKDSGSVAGMTGISHWFLAIASSFRQRFQALYFEHLSKIDANLLIGIVLGIKGSFTKTFSQYLQATGVLHVIAASGMNVSMVGGFLFGLAGKLFNRQKALITTLMGIAFYALVSGFQPSIVRATLMGMMAFGAQLLGRQYAGMYGLGLAGWGMVMVKPSLVFDVGFQLSILSTLGILTIKPLFPKSKAFDDIGTTIAAQMMTLPVLLGNFGTYGILSILVNALILWTIPPLMVLGGIGGVVGMIFEPLGSVLILFCQPFLWIFEHVVSYFGSLGWNVQIQSLPLFMIFGYYCMIAAFLVYKKRKSNIDKFSNATIIA